MHKCIIIDNTVVFLKLQFVKLSTKDQCNYFIDFNVAGNKTFFIGIPQSSRYA